MVQNKLAHKPMSTSISAAPFGKCWLPEKQMSVRLTQKYKRLWRLSKKRKEKKSCLFGCSQRSFKRFMQQEPRWTWCGKYLQPHDSHQDKTSSIYLQLFLPTTSLITSQAFTYQKQKGGLWHFLFVFILLVCLTTFDEVSVSTRQPCQLLLF